jgi:hypothetical protein
VNRVESIAEKTEMSGDQPDIPIFEEGVAGNEPDQRELVVDY